MANQIILTNEKNNYSTIIDFGSNNLRLSVFNDESKNIFLNFKRDL